MRYTAYQLAIESDLALPELLPAPAGQPAGPVDVQIRLADIAPGGLPGGQQLGPFLWATPDSLWLEVPHIARFQVQGGHSILVAPAPSADEDSIRVFLLGSALGALLFQRGQLVLHGNAIRIGDQCMVCVGNSGAGKSTLAAGFMQRGYSVLADDVVPVDRQGRAVPGFPRIKLWQDTADQLQIDTGGLRRIRPHLEKFNLPLGPRFADQALPIRWVYLLDSGHVEQVEFAPIKGMERFMPLYDHTYRVRFLQGMALKGEHLQLCGQLAGQIRLAQVTRPTAGFELDPLIDRLLADMEAHP